jgi:aminoglycoside phosphotransferase (APT) family kinase protein
MTHSSENTLSKKALQWIVDSVNPFARVESVERLQGGISSIVHSVSLRSGDSTIEYVIRQFDNRHWLRAEPDLVLHEVGSLRQVAGVDLPTPDLIAFDETGIHSGMPSVLMSKLEGSVILEPSDRAIWLDGLAQSLVAIHQVTANDHPWSYRTYIDLNSLETPTWSSYPQSWGKAINIAQGPKPLFKDVFVHRDYHPTNVLWQHNKVSGVVDWVNACKGPAGIDIGHCRWNLAMLYDSTVADLFLSRYEAYASSTFRYDPYWDILSIMDTLFGTPEVYAGWTALGITGLTNQMMCERSDAYLLSVLYRTNYI